MAININITIKKRYLYIFSVLLVAALGAVFVNAFNSGGPAATFGHSAEEVGLNVTCSSTQKLTSDGENVSCAADINTQDGQVYDLVSRSQVTSSGTPTANACCGPGNNLLTGGCECPGGNISTNRPACANNNGWSCTCTAGAATAIADCLTAD